MMWHYLASGWFSYYCGASILASCGMMWYVRSKYPNGGVMIMVHRLIDTLLVLGGPITWPYVLRQTWRTYLKQRQRRTYQLRSIDFDIEKQD